MNGHMDAAVGLVEWFPAHRHGHPDHPHPIVWHVGPPGNGRLQDLDGHQHTATTIHLRKAAGQLGASAAAIEVGPRHVLLQVEVSGVDHHEYEHHRAVLASVLSEAPSTPGEDEPQLGLLRIRRHGEPDVETAAIPHQSPRRIVRHALFELVEIEFICPSPLWWLVGPEHAEVLSGGGAGWVAPWEAPWEADASTVEAVIDSHADVPHPMRVRFHGPQTAPRLVQVEGPHAGAEIRLTGAVGPGEMVEVDTGVVRKRVRLDGTDALDLWDFDVSDWLQVPPGHSRWRWEPATAGDGARAVMFHRPAVAGW